MRLRTPARERSFVLASPAHPLAVKSSKRQPSRLNAARKSAAKSKPIRPQQLLWVIKQTSAVGLICRLLVEHKSVVNSIHISAAFSNLVQSVQHQGYDKDWSALQGFLTTLVSSWSIAQLTSFRSRDLSTVLWALARLKMPLEATQLQVFLDAVFEQCSSFNPQDICLTLWALQRLQAPITQHWLHHVLDQQSKQLETYMPRELALSAYAVARTGQPALTSWTTALLAASERHLNNCPARDLSTLLWSVSKLGMSASNMRPWLHKWLQASQAQLPDFASAELSAAVVALSCLSCRPPRAWLRRLYGQLYWTADQFELQQITAIIASLARLGCVPPAELMDRLLAFAGLKLARSAVAESEQELSMLLYGLARMRYNPDSDWLVGYQQLLVRAWPSMSPQSLSILLWSMAQLGIQLDQDHVPQLMQRYQQLLPSFTSQGLAMSMWALVQMGLTLDASLQRQWVQHTYRILHCCKVQELCMMLCAAARLGIPMSADWVGLATDRLEVLAHQLSAAGVVKVAAVLAQMQIVPSPTLMESFDQRMEALCQQQHVSTALWQKYSHTMSELRAMSS